MSLQDLVLSIAGMIAEKSVGPILNQFRYLFCYNVNIQALGDELNKLEQQKAEVERLVNAARDNGEEIKTVVTGWQKEVDDLKSEADAIFAGMENVKMNCFNIGLPNLKSRYLLGRGAAKRTNVAQKLLDSGKFDEVGYISSLRKLPYSLSTESFDQGLITRMSTKKEVMEALKQDKTSVVAICGMGGVGKTTLVNQIADQVKFEKLFDDVAMAIVSQNPDIRNVQNQLAEQLGLTLNSEQTNRARAERLHTRLNQSDKSVLVILDDIWKEFDFLSLGIPTKGECKSLKVILTSRFPDVCSNMGAEIVEVNPLPEEEAWHLFKKAAEISEDSILSNVAKQFAKECQGLPLAIVVVAKALKNRKTLNYWNRALRDLKKHTMRSLGREVQDLVFSRIEWSYNYLENAETKSLLLLCSLFPEDYSIPIECLVRYGKGLQLFQDRETLGDIRDGVAKLIDDLKSCYLLLNGEEEDSVKLHDVVRDVCLSIASKGKHVFLVRNANLEEWQPQRDSFGAYTAISLTLKGSIEQFPFDSECPRLKLLRLVCQSGLLNLSKDSFAGMNDLRVVEFKELELKFSPIGSGQMFTGLRTLCLDYCVLGTGTSSMIASLMHLEVLSFFKSEFQDQFPTEITKLSKLKLLDLRFKSSTQPLSCGILSSLRRLEELYMGSHHHLQLGRDKEEERTCLEEITSLSSLESLQIHIYDFNLLLRFFQKIDVERLLRFSIVGADGEINSRDPDEDYQFRRSFELHLSHTEHLDQLSLPAMTSIFNKSENLSLRNIPSSTSRNVVIGLDKYDFVNLKRLKLKGGEYTSLIDSTTNPVAPHAFENLVSIRLVQTNLHEICRGNLPPQCFRQLEEVGIQDSRIAYLWKGPIEPPSLCNLKNLEIFGCSLISTIFSQSAVRSLVKLQSLYVSGCGDLLSIISREESVNKKVLKIPQLKILYLHKVEALLSFDSSDIMGKNFLNQVSLPRLEQLSLIRCSNQVKQLVGSEMLSGSLENLKSLVLSDCSIACIAKADGVTLLRNLQSFVVSSCEVMEFLFDFEGLNVNPTDLSEKGLEILPKLDSFTLYSLGLTHIWRNFPKGIQVFQSLKILVVSGCGRLHCLFSPPFVANMLVSLEVLEVNYCTEMSEVISGKDEEDDVGKHSENALKRTTKEFVFPKLNTLALTYLRNLESFSGSHREDCEFKFPSLIQLEIRDCPKLKKLVSGKLNAPRLDKVKVIPNQTIPVDLEDREVEFLLLSMIN